VSLSAFSGAVLYVGYSALLSFLCFILTGKFESYPVWACDEEAD
jgi:hypothetical protein